MSGTLKRTVPVVMGLTMAAVAYGAYPSARGADRVGAAPAPTPVVLTNAEALKREQDILKISGVPAGAVNNSPNTYPMDDAIATPYPNLPDPLTFNNGTKVKTAAQWKQRRLEVKDLVERDLYGYRPKVTPKVTWTVVGTTNGTSGTTPIVTKNLVGRVDNSLYPALNVTIRATLTVPANAVGVPVVINLGGAAFALPEGVPATTNLCPAPNRGGGAAPAAGGRAGAPAGAAAAGRAGAAGGRGIQLDPQQAAAAARGGAGAAGGRAGGAPGGGQAGPSATDQLIAKGWGSAAVNINDAQADNGCGLTQGIIGLVNKGQPRAIDDWGVLSAWGWSASRLLDYLQTDAQVDWKRVATTGHSRNGKAAGLAVALDERFSTVFISSSGEGGAKLNRRKWGETIENVGTTYFYWMSGNFQKYTGHWDQMPVDSHFTIALIAPRPVYISGGNDPQKNSDGTYHTVINANGQQQLVNAFDAWVDAKGSWMAEVGANPVYKLLGKKPISETYPAVDTPLLEGDLAFYQHTSGHTQGPAWPNFIKWVSRYWDAPMKMASAR